MKATTSTRFNWRPLGWRLHISGGAHAGTRLVLRSGAIAVLGSGADCDWVLQDPGVAPQHCVFSADGDCQVRPLGGAVFINGEEVTAAAPLRPGDKLKLGEMALEVGQPLLLSRLGAALGRAGTRWLALTGSLAVALFVGIAHSRLQPEPAPAVPVPVPVAAIPAADATPRLAEQVEEILRLLGIAAEAEEVEEGVVQVRGHFGPNDATLQPALQSRALRELRGLQRLLAVNLDSPAEPEAAQEPVARLRLVRIVSGANPYAVLDDGSQYFPGAILPGGATLVAIEPHALVVMGETGQTRLAVGHEF